MIHNDDAHKRSSVFYDTKNNNVHEYQKKSQQIRREKESFLNREFDYRDYIFAPEGYEGIMLFIYILITPYVSGLSFLYLFIARASYQYFLEFNLASYFIIWAIGYEICAVTILGILFYAWFRGDKSDDNHSMRRSTNVRFRN